MANRRLEASMKSLFVLLTAAILAAATGTSGPSLNWSMQVSATAGAALIAHDSLEAEQFRLGCRGEPMALFVMASGLSAEVATLAFDTLTITVQSEDDGGAWIVPLNEKIIVALRSTEALELSNSGAPLWEQAPPEQLTSALAAACGKLLEPHRDLWRLFGLSYAAMAGCSSAA